MCMRKLVVTNLIYLGSRFICAEAYSLPKGEVVELTEAQLKKFIKQGPDEVYGLKLSDTNELVFDETFYTRNLMKKIHTGVLTPLEENETVVANLFYLVIGTHKEGNETMYDVISSRYERNSFNAEKVKTLIELGIITSGAKLENGKIVVAALEKVKPTEPKPKITKSENVKEEVKTAVEAKPAAEVKTELKKEAESKPTADSGKGKGEKK